MDEAASDQAWGEADPGAFVASIIIPLRASPQLFEWKARLTRLLEELPRERFETVIVDYGTPAASRPEFDAVVSAARPPVRLIRVECKEAPFAIGKARNIGAKEARAPVVLFHDIDFLAPRTTYEAVADEIRRRDLARRFERFFCVPVIFLTEAGTRDYLAGTGGIAPPDRHASFCQLALSAAPACAFVAYASSCMVANRAHYLAVGGHDETFEGHGAEDFELLHRVFSVAPKAARPPAYYIDFKDNGIGRYRGFRAAFALYGIEAFQSGIFLVHLHHPPRPMKGYARRRKENFRLLRQRMERFDKALEHPPPLSDQSRGSMSLTSPPQPADSMLSLDSPAFSSFGGRPAMERAISAAALEQERGADRVSLARRGWGATVALKLYSLPMLWRLSRKDRILLRHEPTEFLAGRPTVPARLLLRLLHWDNPDASP